MTSGGKQKRTRSVNKTALIYCEGQHDLAFIRFLIFLYSQAKATTTRFQVKQGRGGSPDTLLLEAKNIPGDFDRRLVKTDLDRSAAEIQKAKLIAYQYDIAIVWSKPCLEALLLSIQDKQDYTRFQSKTCKRLFEQRYIPASKRSDRKAYESAFTFETIENARQRIPELELLISFITS